MTWIGTAVLVVVLLATANLAQAAAPVRALHGKGACVSVARDKGCAPGRGFTNPPIDPGGAAVSADGRSLYIVSGNANAIGIVNIDPASGRISQRAGTSGCLAEHERGREVARCATARGFAGETDVVVVSPDDRFVYVTSETDTDEHPNTRRVVLAVAVFARDETGRLRQLPGVEGCMANAALDDCAVVPTLGARGISLSPDGARMYLGGEDFTVLARDQVTGVLSYVACENADATKGCVRSPFGVALSAPAWVGGFGYTTISANTVGDALVALRLGESGLPELLPGPGNCFDDFYFNRAFPGACPREDEGFYGYVEGIIPAHDELVLFNATDPNELEIDYLFRLWTVRLGATGTMSRTGAHCLSTHRTRRCKRARLLLGGAAITGNARRIYVAGKLGVTAIARGRSGALRVLGRGKPARWQWLPPNEAVSTRDGRFVYLIYGDFYGTGTVHAYATNVPAAPAAARTSP